MTDSIIAHLEEGHVGVVKLGPETQHLYINGVGRVPQWIIERRAEFV